MKTYTIREVACLTKTTLHLEEALERLGGPQRLGGSPAPQDSVKAICLILLFPTQIHSLQMSLGYEAKGNLASPVKAPAYPAFLRYSPSEKHQLAVSWKGLRTAPCGENTLFHSV